MSLKIVKKKSAKRGGSTLAAEVEVLNISSHGLWLLAKDREYFLPYEKFPWFRKASVADVCKVKLLHGYHLYWPALDVDVEWVSLERLENYPLIYK